MLFRLLAGCAMAVCASAADFTVESDVEYGRAGEKPLLLDVYRPADAAKEPRAALILVHGGGWIGGDKREFRPLGEQAARAGYVVFSVNYRLVFGKENIWPAPLDDCQRAVRWVRENAAKYQIDPNRIGAIGGSAGGHLVALLGMVDTRDNSDAALAKQSSRVRCVVDIFGPTDLTAEIGDRIPLGKTADELIRGLLGGPISEKADAARAASPLFQIDAKTAPFLIFHGSQDAIVPPDHSERLDAALRKAGIDSKLIIFPDDGHGFAKKKNQERFEQEILAFLAKHLAP